MKLSRFKILLIAPSILLTSCGYGLKETYKGVPYNSTNYEENYFINNVIILKYDRKNTKNLSESKFSCFFELSEFFPIFALPK